MDQLTRDIINWDVVNWSLSLRFWEKHAELPDKPLRCLELGSRNGGLSLWLARKGYHVICSDVSDPGKASSPLHSHYGVTEKVDYESIDAISIPYESYFDLVIFKSVLGAVGRNGRDDLQQKCLEEILKCLKPGGQLLFAENLRGTKMHQFFRHRFVKWSRSWNYLQYDKVQGLLSGFNQYKCETAGFLGMLGPNETWRGVLGKVDQKIFHHLVPERSRYIIFCAARK